MIINIAEIRNRKIKQRQIEFNNDKDYITIPLIRDNEEYNRTKVKRQTKKLIEEYER